MRKLWHENSLTITLMALFFVSILGQFVTGIETYNSERSQHHLPPLSVSSYFQSGHFIESVFENWESEFLQMGVYVVLTAFLFQKGSAESNPLPEDADGNPTKRVNKKYSFLRRNGLSLALFVLFLISFILHAVGGFKLYNEEQIAHQEETKTFFQFFYSSEFWFQSLQNWQSEFLSVAVLLVLSIFLRQEGSSQSKAVNDPNSKTGT